MIPDRRSPDRLYQVCHEYADRGLDIQCPSLDEQTEFLHRTGGFAKLVPYNSAGAPIDRLDDIFSGYLCQACVRHLGDRIRVGTPIVCANGSKPALW